MKNKNKILLMCVAVLVLMQPIFAISMRREVDPVPAKYKNLFVFKADRKFIGAKVEVLAADGDVVTVQKLQKRKMIIDFCDVKQGSYTIRVTKGDAVKEFRYEKKKAKKI